MPNNASSLIARGSFVSTGARQQIVIQPLVDYFMLRNRTNWQKNPFIAADLLQADWFASMAQDSAYAMRATAGAPPQPITASFISSGGISLIDYNNQPIYPKLALAAPFLTPGNPTVFTTALAHNYAVGDIVQVTQTTAALQFAGTTYQVASVPTPTSFGVMVDSTAAPAATAGFVQRLALDDFFFQQRRIIGAMTMGLSTVVQLTQPNTFTVGQIVKLSIPSIFGAVGLSGVQAQITAVNSTALVNTITLAYDSSAIAAFAYPVSASVPFTLPYVEPVGEFATTLAGAEFNQLVQGVLLGANVVGTAGNIIDWWAFKADVIV